MPKLEEGWTVVPVERILEEPSQSLALLRGVSRCGCVLVDTPFVASVEAKGVLVDVAVGVGSFVCPSGCGFEGWRLARPAWASGVLVGGSCTVYGEAAEELASGLGVGVERREGSLEDALEDVKTGRRVVVSLVDARELSVEVSDGVCGLVEAVNPLHPSAVVGKPYVSGCVKKVAEPIGRLARLLTPLLRVKRRPVLWLFRATGEALLLGYDYRDSSSHLALAAALGVLYTCGVRRD